MSTPTEGDRFLVVGGGPAAAAAASALVRAGRPVTIIDAGQTLDPAREQSRRRLAATSPENWPEQDRLRLRPSLGADGQLATKQLFGSDLALAPLPAAGIVPGAEVGARPSFALGGLSNIWGAGITPYSDDDLAGWPITFEELRPSYERVLDLVPYSARDDGLSDRYPLLRDPDGYLLPSEEALDLLDRLEGDRERLRRLGTVVGGARLAVRAGRPAPAQGCIYCGECLNGCVYGHIYSAAQTIAALRGEPLVEYRGGELVTDVGEDGERVVARTVDVASGERRTHEGRRLLIGAGPVSTTAVLQRSHLLDARAEILDSQAVFLPFLRLQVPRRRPSASYTLAQLFIAVQSAEMAHNAHVSLYPYDSSMVARARAVRPGLARALGPALEIALRQIVTGIATLHSDDSHRVASRFDESSGEVRLERVERPSADAARRRLYRALRESLRRSGLHLLTPFVEVASVGASHHYGGSVPMRAEPRAGESDVLGRPSGSSRIHVVDASCFPTIPGGTITLSTMANADRIASIAAALDGSP